MTHLQLHTGTRGTGDEIRIITWTSRDPPHTSDLRWKCQRIPGGGENATRRRSKNDAILTWWTKTSCSPSSGVMKPNPFTRLNHLHRPRRRSEPPPEGKRQSDLARDISPTEFDEGIDGGQRLTAAMTPRWGVALKSGSGASGLRQRSGRRVRRSIHSASPYLDREKSNPGISNERVEISSGIEEFHIKDTSNEQQGRTWSATDTALLNTDPSEEWIWNPNIPV